MPDTPDAFDPRESMTEKQGLLRQVQTTRDMLTTDLVNYYWDTELRSEADAEQFKANVRKYARRAIEQLDAVIRDMR